MTPNYYAIIPASVRYDDRLTPNAKLLYGEITALCSKEGFCWATSAYFAKLYGVHRQRVSEWIAQLEEAGHIKSEINPSKGNERRLFIIEAGEGGRPKNRTRSSEKSDNPSSEKSDNSITTRESIAKNTLVGSGKFDEFWEEYPTIRRYDKAKCRAKFEKAEQEGLADTIIDDVKKRKAEDEQWTKDGGRFIPAPLVYLNQKRWEAAIIKPTTKGNIYKNTQDADRRAKLSAAIAKRSVTQTA